jgi:hypothetical protein
MRYPDEPVDRGETPPGNEPAPGAQAPEPWHQSAAPGAVPGDSDREGATSFPWPPARGESLVQALGDTWVGAALHPVRFFRSMPPQGTIRSALLFYLPLGIAAFAASTFWTLMLERPGAEQELVLGEFALGAPANPLLELLLSPLLLLFSLFLAAGVTHGLLRLLGGASGPFSLTTRVFAFAYAPQILAIVPWVGMPLGFVWMVGIGVIGVREAHRTTTGRALAAVLVPVIIALILLAVAALLVSLGGNLLSH